MACVPYRITARKVLATVPEWCGRQSRLPAGKLCQVGRDVGRVGRMLSAAFTFGKEFIS